MYWRLGQWSKNLIFHITDSKLRQLHTCTPSRLSLRSVAVRCTHIQHTCEDTQKSGIRLNWQGPGAPSNICSPLCDGCPEKTVNKSSSPRDVTPSLESREIKLGFFSSSFFFFCMYLISVAPVDHLVFW